MHDPVQGALDGRALSGLPVSPGEHQLSEIALRGPIRTGTKGLLEGLLTTQGLLNMGLHGNHSSSLPGFGSLDGEVELLIFPTFYINKSFIDGDGFAFEINVIPVEREQFSNPHSCTQQNGESGLGEGPAVLPDKTQKSGLFFRREDSALGVL